MRCKDAIKKGLRTEEIQEAAFSCVGRPEYRQTDTGAHDLPTAIVRQDGLDPAAQAFRSGSS